MLLHQGNRSLNVQSDSAVNGGEAALSRQFVVLDPRRTGVKDLGFKTTYLLTNP